MLEIAHLTKRYGAVRALDGATFTARRGRLVGFLGPKRRGQDHDDALRVRARDARRRHVRWDGRRSPTSTAGASATCPRSAASTPGCGSREQLVYFGRLHGLSRGVARAEAGERLERFGLADRAKSKLEDSRTATSSGSSSPRRSSTTRRCSSSTSRSAASTRSASPRWPTCSASARGGVPVLFSSHQLDLVEDVCEDVVIISRGRVVAEGAIEELKARSGGGTSTSRSRAPAAPGSTAWPATPSSSATATA